MSQTKAQLIDGKVATVEFSGGSASAPSIAFSGDTNTGIYSPGADQLAISTNGTGRLFVDSSGRVGIGTASPGSILHLQQSASAAVGPDLRLVNNAGTASDKARVSFFAGAISPSIRAAYDFNVHSSGVGEFIWSNGEGSLTERMRLDPSGRLGIGNSAPSTALDVTGQITTRGSIGAVVFEPRDASGSVFSFYNPTGDDLRLFANSADRVTITSGGSVGIGTTSPTELLSIGFADSSTGRLEFRTSTYAKVAMIEGSHDGGTANGSLRFWTRNAGTELERARIDSSGRLLVGTSTGGTSTGSGQFRLGGAGSEGGALLLTNYGANVANNGTVDLTVGASSIVIYTGFLIVHAANNGNNADRTQTTFSIFASPQNSSFTATQIATASGGSSSTFTVTSPSAGVIRVTNTRGGASHISMCFMGTGWFMN